VLESKLASKDAGAGIQITIPEGMRAVSVRVNDIIGVTGFIVPGSRVDVILVGSLNGPSDSATTILENVQVLAAGTDVNRDAEGPKPASAVTLLLTPEDSEKLALVTADGRIQLALRHPLDHTVTNPRVVSRTDVLRGSPSRPGGGAPVQVAYRPVAPSPSVLPAPATPPKLAAAPPRVIAPEPPPAPAPELPAKKAEPVVCQPTKVQLITAPDRVQVIQFETKPTGDPKQPCV
jgi:pilus assembly protein CpaB